MITEDSDGWFSAGSNDVPATVQGNYRLAYCCTACDYAEPDYSCMGSQSNQSACCPLCGEMPLVREVGRWTFRLTPTGFGPLSRKPVAYSSFAGNLIVDRLHFTRKSREQNEP